MWAGDTPPGQLYPLKKDLEGIADKSLIIDGGTEMYVPYNDELYQKLTAAGKLLLCKLPNTA